MLAERLDAERGVVASGSLGVNAAIARVLKVGGVPDDE
jgi:hypothetical protein